MEFKEQFPIHVLPPRVQEDIRKHAALWDCDIADMCMCYLAAEVQVGLEFKIISTFDWPESDSEKIESLFEYVEEHKLQKYVKQFAIHHCSPDSVIFTWKNSNTKGELQKGQEVKQL
jgi:hypothetical protein